MRKDVAEKISGMMLDFGGKLDESVKLVQEKCEQEELISYRKAVGRIMGYMLTEIMNPIYEEHPDLKPDRLQ